MPQLTSSYEHLKGLPTDSYATIQPRILIGIDNCHVTRPLNSVERRYNEPVASKTRLGWVIYDSCPIAKNVPGATYLNFHVRSCDGVSEELQNTALKNHSALEIIRAERPSKERRCREDAMLTQQELADAENTLVKHIQPGAYSRDSCSSMRQAEIVHSRRSDSEKDSSLHTVLDGRGLLVVDGRLINTSVRNPPTSGLIILLSKHRGTLILILEFCGRFRHRNDISVINEVRPRFRIPRLPKTCADATQSCRIYRIREAKLDPPIMESQLDPGTLMRHRAFMNIAIDHVRPICASIGRRTEKRRGVWYMCATVRAVHSGAVPLLSRGDGTNSAEAARELMEGVAEVDYEALMMEFFGPVVKWPFNRVGQPPGR